MMPPAAVLALALDVTLALGLAVAIVVQAVKFYRKQPDSER